MSKFRKETAEEILQNMRGGASMQQAAALAGVTRQTMWNWRKAGRAEGMGDKFEFDVQVSKIEAGHIAAAEQTVKAIARQRGDLRAALNAATWFLERRMPDEYGKKITIQVQQQMIEELLDHLRDRISASAYDEVIDALVADGSEPPPIPADLN